MSGSQNVGLVAGVPWGFWSGSMVLGLGRGWGGMMGNMGNMGVMEITNSRITNYRFQISNKKPIDDGRNRRITNYRFQI
jgi:hypothetical protein